jgi:hypothetical protein
MNRLIKRRNVLRGAGVCLALPWLESLAPRGAHAQTLVPKRYLPIYFPNGAASQWWDGAPAFGSSTFGTDFVLGKVHEPLAALKSKLLLVSRIGNYSWHDAGAEPTPFVEPSHSRCPGGLMTCTDVDKKMQAANMNLSSGVINNVSADQVIVQKGNFGTPIDSLQAGLGTFPGTFDGRSYAYSQVLSWKAETSPLKRHVNPKALFDAMISAGVTSGTGMPDAEAEALAKRRAAENKSVLDAVVDSANLLKQGVSRQDRETLDQFTTSFREIEQQVTNVSQTMPASCTVVAEPGSVPEPPGEVQGLNQGQDGYDRQAHAKVMSDLIVMALQCDVTRVITYMLDDSRSEFNYNFIPADDKVFGSGGDLGNCHGGCQHGGGDISGTAEQGVYPGNSNAAYATVTRWFVRQVAELAERLSKIPEGDGSVLDHTLIQMMSDMRTHDHDCYDLPVLLLGGTGFIKQDAHIALSARPSDRQMRDLFYTVQKQYFGLEVASFGEDVRGLPNALIEDILA